MAERNLPPAPDGAPDARDELLTVAALFDGPFSIDWIQEITRKKASEVLYALETAVRQGVLKRDGIGAFVYANEQKRRQWQRKLPAMQQHRYYQRIADTLLRELPDGETKARTVAPYLLQITNDLEGCRRLMTAAAGYRGAFDEDRARRCYHKILEDLSGRSGQGTDQLFCDAALQYSKLTTARHDTQRVLSILEEAMVRARNQGNHRYQSLLDMHFAKNKWLQSQYSSARKHFEQAWSVAGELEDETLLRATTTFKTFFLYWQGRFQEAVNDYEKSLPDVEKFPRHRFPLLAAMTIGTCYGKIGQMTQGIGMIDAVRRHCLERGDMGLAAHSGICIGALLLDHGAVDDACRHLIPAVAQARKTHPDWTMIQGDLVLAHAYHLQGRQTPCLTHLTRYNQHARQVQVSVRTWPFLMELCWAIETGKLPAVPQLDIREEVGQMIQGQNIFLKGVAYRFKSLLQEKEGKPPGTRIQTLKRSIEYLRTSGHAIELAKSQLALARLYLLQSKRGLAEQTAQPAFNTLGTVNPDLIPDDLKPLIQAAGAADTLFKQLVHFNTQLVGLDHGKEMIQHILSAANRMVGAERGAIFLCKPLHGKQRFYLRASKNLSEEQIAHPSFDASLQMMAEVVAQAAGRIRVSPAADRKQPPTLSSESSILSSICVPVTHHRRILGVLYHDNRLLGGAFSEAQLETLAFFAAQMALILENDQIQQENRRLNKRLHDLTAHYERQHLQQHPIQVAAIIGQSRAIQRVMAQIEEVAPTSATVLILGETGVGKGVVANAIQHHSRRQSQPFISLNCNALSETLIASELFGHEKGAFTGAEQQHIGRFEKADGGTLFLDEIGDLPPQVQVRLLRVLETKEFERVGGTTTLKSDFRLIAATNSDLVQAMKEKRFRKDLFYRIHVFTIHVPPLRERREDIAPLVDHFLKVQAAETGKVPPPVTEEQMHLLTQYSWPGNVRELRNITERYAISAASSRINIVDLLAAPLPLSPHGPQAITLHENERRHIAWALEQTGGKVHGPGGAARLLDVHPNTLSFRMKKLGIKKPK